MLHTTPLILGKMVTSFKKVERLHANCAEMSFTLIRSFREDIKELSILITLVEPFHEEEKYVAPSYPQSDIQVSNGNIDKMEIIFNQNISLIDIMFL